MHFRELYWEMGRASRSSCSSAGTTSSGSSRRAGTWPPTTPMAARRRWMRWATSSSFKRDVQKMKALREKELRPIKSMMIDSYKAAMMRHTFAEEGF